METEVTGTAETTSAKQRKGRPFQPGQSGNPNGRPKGARNKITREVEAILSTSGEDVAKAVVERAKGGDMQAARLVLDRLAPLRKGREITFDLPPVETAADVAKALGAVLQAVAAGELTPDEGQTVAGLLEVKRKAIETADIEARLTALETKGGA